MFVSKQGSFFERVLLGRLVLKKREKNELRAMVSAAEKV